MLTFMAARNINLSAMDIYGCGVYGIACYDGTGELYVCQQHHLTAPMARWNTLTATPSPEFHHYRGA